MVCDEIVRGFHDVARFEACAVMTTDAETLLPSGGVVEGFAPSSGQWLRVHVSPMQGEVGPVAVTIELARPDDLARILLDSYGLTPRETDIVLLLARGLSTKEIAAELAISAHTVRDHTRAVYEKAGVGNRGELVAALFANHVLDRFHGALTHVD